MQCDAYLADQVAQPRLCESDTRKEGIAELPLEFLRRRIKRLGLNVGGIRLGLDHE